MVDGWYDSLVLCRHRYLSLEADLFLGRFLAKLRRGKD